MIDVFLFNLSCVFALMSLAWLGSLILQDSSLVDRFWGAGFCVVALATFLQTNHPSLRGLILLITTLLWGVRLSLYLTKRNWNKGEDSRYVEIRKNQGRYFPLLSLFTVFGLQALLCTIIALPLQIGISQTSPASLTPLDLLGLAAWTLGFLFEAIGDMQLAHFKANPANQGKVLHSGLWRYTRHPNYFGDALLWWGFALMALSVENGVWGILGAVLMNFLLLKVSGVAMLESTIKHRRPAYREYMESTSAFIPRPPRN
ncbi:MAG: DUF1295 domain-containing protein [Myxococcota bacterium]|jgi:steroid 5-alpha reductase family enzyme|nr:DUF1295 domain-containing protein [Myxococcota bacterium]